MNISKSSISDKVFLAVVYTTLIVVAFLCLYPLYFTIIASVSDPYAVYTGKVFLVPKGFMLDGYKLVMQNRQIWKGYGNTIFYTVAGTIFNLILTIPTAYVLSKKWLFGRSFLQWLFLFTMYFGGGMVPTYMLYNALHLVNTRWILIISAGLSVYNVIVTRTYFQNNIPETLFEAARIDGASEIKVFLKIVIPLSAPIIAVIALYYAVSHWSSYFSAMIYVSDVDLHPLQLVLRRILILNESAYENAMANNVNQELLEDAEKRSYMALIMKYSLVFIASAPMLIVYPFVQKYFVKGMMIGSVKG